MMPIDFSSLFMGPIYVCLAILLVIALYVGADKLFI